MYNSIQGSYTFSAIKFKDFLRTFKDHIFKFQGPYLLLLTHVPNKLKKYPDNNGPFFLMATIFIKICLWVLIKELPSEMNKAIIVTMLLIKSSSTKIQGLSRTKMNERKF